MTLNQIKETVNSTLENHDLKDIENERIFLYICRNRKPHLTSDDLLEYGISQSNFSSHFKKCVVLSELNPDYKKVVDEIQFRLDHTTNVDSISFEKMIDMVKEFRQTFELRVKEKPSLLTKSEYELHYKLLKEEMKEYFDACEDGDKVEVLDAQVDLLYILLGSILHHGMQKVFIKAFSEVHASNMSKLQNGKVLKRDDGKVLKGDNFFEPNLKQFL